MNGVQCNIYSIIDNKPDPTYIATLSPDGRVFALAQCIGETWRINSWRDGTLLGQATVTWPLPQAEVTIRRLQATNCGRIWLYSVQDERNRFWAIDGVHVAGGSVAIPSGGTPINSFSISPAGTAMFSRDRGILHYFTLQVRGTTVIPTLCYRISCEESFIWFDDERLLGNNGALLDSTGIVNSPQGWRMASSICAYPCFFQFDVSDYASRRIRIFRPKPLDSWIIPTTKQIYQGTVLRDGSTAVVVEGGLRQTPILDLLEKIPYVDRIKPGPSRIAVYTAPGHLRAILPSHKGREELEEVALSPDARHVGLLYHKPDGGQELRLYTW